ncbi:unnamed protein product [Vitrella brassicaformis CCMP3155]|uniref:J domain-containing protein n=1 Tax=Vitrella brassicaformis (strain CCMP3155) TaxID=1169540 RepID=A0A0G4FIY5_VITBC|nr:unnamed protein product [Vitrella brassicaformis CCMP3155]|eukprot:CEM13264.1 unnamed protein product [Vitrella brassicaformis CCMP3155]
MGASGSKTSRRVKGGGKRVASELCPGPWPRRKSSSKQAAKGHSKGGRRRSRSTDPDKPSSERNKGHSPPSASTGSPLPRADDDISPSSASNQAAPTSMPVTSTGEPPASQSDGGGTDEGPGPEPVLTTPPLYPLTPRAAKSPSNTMIRLEYRDLLKDLRGTFSELKRQCGEWWFRLKEELDLQTAVWQSEGGEGDGKEGRETIQKVIIEAAQSGAMYQLLTALEEGRDKGVDIMGSLRETAEALSRTEESLVVHQELLMAIAQADRVQLDMWIEHAAAINMKLDPRVFDLADRLHAEETEALNRLDNRQKEVRAQEKLTFAVETRDPEILMSAIGDAIACELDVKDAEKVLQEVIEELQKIREIRRKHQQSRPRASRPSLSEGQRKQPPAAPTAASTAAAGGGGPAGPTAPPPLRPTQPAGRGDSAGEGEAPFNWQKRPTSYAFNRAATADGGWVHNVRASTNQQRQDRPREQPQRETSRPPPSKPQQQAAKAKGGGRGGGQKERWFTEPREWEQEAQRRFRTPPPRPRAPPPIHRAASAEEISPTRRFYDSETTSSDLSSDLPSRRRQRGPQRSRRPRDTSSSSGASHRAARKPYPQTKKPNYYTSPAYQNQQRGQGLPKGRGPSMAGGGTGGGGGGRGRGPSGGAPSASARAGSGSAARGREHVPGRGGSRPTHPSQPSSQQSHRQGAVAAKRQWALPVEHLRVLDLPTTAIPSQAQLKAAYRQAALRWHPDRRQNHTQQDKATDMFQKVREAFDMLMPMASP